jgi:hypothetical protein
MNFTKNHNIKKEEIKIMFPLLFKAQDINNITTHKLKEIKLIPNELVQDYDTRFKDLLFKSPTQSTRSFSCNG